MLCCQRKSRNRVGYIAKSDVLCTKTSFKCEICGLVLSSQDHFDKDIETRICSLYFICSSCSGKIPVHSSEIHHCPKKRCSVCSQHFEHSSQEIHEGSVQKSRSHVRYVFCESDVGTSRQISKEGEEEPIDYDACTGFLDIKTEQSCDNKNDHVHFLLVTQNLGVLESIFFEYDCIAAFCASIFEDEAGIWKQERFIANVGKGFHFLPILQWLFEEPIFVPKIVLLGNKVISLRVGNEPFIDSYFSIPLPLANFRKYLVSKNYGKFSFRAISHPMKQSQSLQLPSIYRVAAKPRLVVRYNNIFHKTAITAPRNAERRGNQLRRAKKGLQF